MSHASSEIKRMETLRQCIEALRRWISVQPPPEPVGGFNDGYWHGLDDVKDILDAALEKPDTAAPRYRYNGEGSR